jgi:hypothetical protein
MHGRDRKSIRIFGRQGFAKQKAKGLNALSAVCFEVDTYPLTTPIKTLMNT